MSISLQKGQKVSLSKESAGLTSIMVGLGWDEAERAPAPKPGLFKKAEPAPPPIDCDASAIMLKNGRLADKDEDLIYYAHLCHKTGCVQHQGDNLTGAGDGDDEQIEINLAGVPMDYDKIVIVVNIFQAAERNQHFGMIENAFIRLEDNSNGRELCRYDLTENYSGMTAMIFGEVYRHNGEWKFNAIGQGTTDRNISELCMKYK